MRILFFGDIIGKTGRAFLTQYLPQLKAEFKPDLTIANAENVAHGLGVTAKTVQQVFDAGVDFLTTGNHVFDKAEQVADVFEEFDGKIIRPKNFVGDFPGKGVAELAVKGQKVYVANFNAQVFMEKQFRGMIGSPFASFDQLLQEIDKSAILLVDFHSEATSEKRGFGYYIDGRASAVWGTHTHVQTADAQIMPGGTAYISDVGMVGAADTILGVKKQMALDRFLKGGEGSKLEVEESNEAEAGYIVIEIDEQTKRARAIRPFLKRYSLK